MNYAIVHDTPTMIPDGMKLIQNLGPDPIRIGGPDVTGANGFHVTANACVAVGPKCYVITSAADQTADVRVLFGGLAFSMTS